jgi:hypothetical protein
MRTCSIPGISKLGQSRSISWAARKSDPGDTFGAIDFAPTRRLPCSATMHALEVPEKWCWIFGRIGTIAYTAHSSHTSAACSRFSWSCHTQANCTPFAFILRCSTLTQLVERLFALSEKGERKLHTRFSSRCFLSLLCSVTHRLARQPGDNIKQSISAPGEKIS